MINDVKRYNVPIHSNVRVIAKILSKQTLWPIHLNESECESEKNQRTSRKDQRKKIQTIVFAYAQCEWSLKVHVVNQI